MDWARAEAPSHRPRPFALQDQHGRLPLPLFLRPTLLRIETQARELALQALYQRDLAPERDREELRRFCAREAGPKLLELAMELIDGCLEHREQLDRLIRQTAENWELERMATSDRNILRLGAYELLFHGQTPPKVAINEAIELAKRYSTENSPTFVNGVLDRIYNTCMRKSIQPDPDARADLHLHSTASDGSVAPEQLPRLAEQAGLSAMALTDHDSVQGIAAAREAARTLEIIVVAGMELTAYVPALDTDRKLEMHVAGLFVDADSPSLLQKLQDLRETRVERVHEIADRLKEAGVDLSAEEVLGEAGGGAVGRSHVAQHLVGKGQCNTVREAFQRYLTPGRPGYVPKQEMTPAEAVELVHEAGGCAVLCHPGLIDGVERYLEELLTAGLDALEVHYPRHSAEDEKRLMELAREYDLLVTGGSDFHGAPKPDIHIGQETVSFVELHRLQQRTAAGLG